MLTTKVPNLLIIGGGELQVPTLIECCFLNLGKIIVDGNPDCACSKSPYFNNDFFVHADIKKPELVLSQVRKWLKAHPKVKIVGVYTQGCDVAYTVACVADKLGLPNIGVKEAFNSHNKIAMRNIFAKNNILQPKLYIGEVHFPCVVKPVDNCASRGITIVRKPEDLRTAVELAKKFSTDGKYLIEQFIEGNEYSVDTVVYKGKVYPAGISDRVFLDKDNYAVQDGSLTPSLLPAETQQMMYWVMEECAKALGIKWGAFKGDLIVDANKTISVIEVTARLSGGFDAQYRKPYSFGINLIKATIDLACGKPLDFTDLIPKWFKYSQTFTVFPAPGTIKEIRGLDELKNISGIKKCFLSKNVGDKVDYKNCTDRVIHIIACSDTYEQLKETINRAKETVKFITE